jgi:hypothetical protein
MKSAVIILVIAAITASSQAQLATNVEFSTGGTNVPGFTGFFNSADGWNNALDPAWQGQQGWTGSGSGADSVSVITDVTPTSPGGNASGTLGLFLPALPLNTANVYLDRAFTPGDPFLTNVTVSLVAEWTILEVPLATALNDTFIFDLRTADNAASVLTFQMNNVGVSDPLIYNYLVSSVGATTEDQFETTYGGLGGVVMRMQVDLTGTTFSGTYSALNGATRNVVGGGLLNSGTLAGGFNALDFGVLRLGWNLASNDADLPGDLYIAVNEFTVTTSGTVIPEPGTWATAALLGLATIGVMYRRRRAASASTVP